MHITDQGVIVYEPGLNLVGAFILGGGAFYILTDSGEESTERLIVTVSSSGEEGSHGFGFHFYY